jgi:hypothetical protein
MRSIVSLSVVGLIFGTSTAFAGDVPNPPSTPTSTAAASAPTSTATPTAAKPAADSAKNAATELTADEKRLISSGYKLEVKGDKRLFCRREATLGSRFEKKVCGTADQLASQTRDSKDVTESAQRTAIPLQGH